MKDFYQLTYRGRARRLRQMALIALEEYDLSLKNIRLVTNETNCIFRIDTESGEKFILRISEPLGAHNLDEIRSEMMWLTALHQETQLGVPIPLHTRAGGQVVTVETDGVPEPRHCAIFSWVPGVDLAERLTIQNVQSLGKLSASLHNHAREFRSPNAFRVRKLDKVFPYSDTSFPHVEPVVLFEKEHRELISEERFELFRRAISRVQNALDKLYTDPEDLLVTHNDLHQWNVRVYRGKLFAIDFEDLAWGFPVQDIATTLFYFQGYDQRKELLSAFKSGYSSICRWPETYPGQIETFIAGRSIMLSNYLLSSQNPEDRAYAPDYLARVEKRLAAFLAGK